MSKQNYDVLSDQIGDFGANDETQESIGRLKHKAAYGQKEDLTDDEQQKLDSFLDRSRETSKKNKEDLELSITNGWIPINREELGIRSLFYDSNWEFYIRPATVQAIKNWTAIDEERPDVLNKVFNEILKSCVKIDTHSDKTANWSHIKSWDRFWFVLKVREYTYSNNKYKIEFIDECTECNSDINFDLNSSHLFYEFPDEDIVNKYWTGSNWHIDPREYDVDHDEITLYTPTLGVDESIIEWATAKVRTGGKYDETFIKFLVWLLPKPSKDLQMLDRQVNQIYKEYKKWDLDMFTFMNDVVNNITINQSEKLKMVCPNCGQEVTSTVQFPDGIKVLFKNTSTVKKFGSR